MQIAELRELGKSLRVALQQAAGDSKSIPELQSRVEVDKSLASRVLRAARSTDDLKVLLLFPSAEGLQLLARRLAARTRFKESMAVMQAAAELATLVKRMPRGVQSLSVVVEGLTDDPERLPKRYATRAAFQAASAMYGILADERSIAYVFHPDHEGIERGFLQSWSGLRRLRTGMSFSLGAFRTSRDDENLPRALDGTPLAAHNYVLNDLSDGIGTAVQLHATSDRVLALLEKEQPPLGISAAFASGARWWRPWSLWDADHSLVVRTRLPTRHLSLEVLVPAGIASEPPDAVVAISDSAYELVSEAISRTTDVLFSVHATSTDASPHRTSGYLVDRMRMRDQQFRSWRYEVAFPPLGGELRVLMPREMGRKI